MTFTIHREAACLADVAANPVLSAIDSLLAIETPAMRFLRVNAEAIGRAHAEMTAELATPTRESIDD